MANRTSLITSSKDHLLNVNNMDNKEGFTLTRHDKTHGNIYIYVCVCVCVCVCDTNIWSVATS